MGKYGPTANNVCLWPSIVCPFVHLSVCQLKYFIFSAKVESKSDFLHAQMRLSNLLNFIPRIRFSNPDANTNKYHHTHTRIQSHFNINKLQLWGGNSCGLAFPFGLLSASITTNRSLWVYFFCYLWPLGNEFRSYKDTRYEII